LCKQFNFNGFIQPLVDWGTWISVPVNTPDTWTIENGTFLDHNVADSTHPQHTKFLQVLNDVKKHNYKFLTINSFFNQFQ
jgi:hypothetical protein